MTHHVTNEELRLRRALDQSVQEMRVGLERCPYLDDLYALADEHVSNVAQSVAVINGALRDALTCTEALAQLRGASEDAIVLAGVSRTALSVVQQVLAGMTAAIDCRQAA